MRTGKNHEAEVVFAGWWRGLSNVAAGRPRGGPTGRAELALLRRIDVVQTADGPVVDVAYALTIESFRRLRERLLAVDAGYGSGGPRGDELIAVAAACLAHARTEERGKSSAAALGGSERAEDRKLPEVRFLRLLRTRDPADLLDQGRRLMGFLKDCAPVGDLGHSLWCWPDDALLRRRWAEDYYGLRRPSALPENSSFPSA